MDSMEYNRANEMTISALLGVIFSLGVVYFLNKYPGVPFDYANDRYLDSVALKKKDDDAYMTNDDDSVLPTNDRSHNRSEEDIGVAQYIENLNEDDMVKSTQKMRNIFGISEENVREAVRQTKLDVQTGGPISDESFTYAQLLDILVLCGIVAACIYFIDVEAHGLHGDISKVLQALFPLELNTLGVGRGARGGRE